MNNPDSQAQSVAGRMRTLRSGTEAAALAIEKTIYAILERFKLLEERMERLERSLAPATHEQCDTAR